MSAVLRSLSPETYEVQAEAAGERVLIPVTIRPDGSVEIAQSYAVLPDRRLVGARGLA